MPKKLLISYTGKAPVEIDLAGAFALEEKAAKREKRETAFERVAVDRSGTLTLRKNTTALVSASELDVIRNVLGETPFKRYVVEHGEYVVRKRQKTKMQASQPRPELKPVVPQPESMSEIKVSDKKKNKPGK